MRNRHCCTTWGVRSSPGHEPDTSLQGNRWPSARRAEVRPDSVTRRARRREPVHLEAFAQRHPGAVEDHPEIIRGNGEFRTDLVAVELHHLAHHEHARRVGRQLLEAEVHDVEELAATSAGSGSPQSAGERLPRAACREQARRNPRRRASSSSVRAATGSRCFRRIASTILCLRMPVSQVLRLDLPVNRPSPKRGDQRVLHDVLGERGRAAAAAQRATGSRAAFPVASGSRRPSQEPLRNAQC